jgi:hypothetical protein
MAAQAYWGSGTGNRDQDQEQTAGEARHDEDHVGYALRHARGKGAQVIVAGQFGKL